MNEWTLEAKKIPIDEELYFVSVCDDSGDNKYYYTDIATCFHTENGRYDWINHDERVRGVYAWQQVIYPKPAPH